jgi:hypothetical protein
MKTLGVYICAVFDGGALVSLALSQCFIFFKRLGLKGFRRLLPRKEREQRAREEKGIESDPRLIHAQRNDIGAFGGYCRKTREQTSVAIYELNFKYFTFRNQYTCLYTYICRYACLVDPLLFPLRNAKKCAIFANQRTTTFT